MMTMCCVALAVSAALAQQEKAAPPPKPAADDRNFGTTMKFIQDKLTEQDTFSYRLFMHPLVNNRDSEKGWWTALSDVRADVAKCRLFYHIANKEHGQPLYLDESFDLKAVTSIEVSGIEEDL